MRESPSLSVFAVEVDRRPAFAFASKTHVAAEAILKGEELRTKLSALKSGGAPLCDDYGIMRLRLARPAEREIYEDRRFGRIHHNEFYGAFLVELDRDAGSLDHVLDELIDLGNPEGLD
ncbi:hypothetical protein ACT4MK_02350 [Bradyrhizobium barranii]|uniref:hypothetical protein n=1 Tax=Bradyrhizobium TaxID=374 RepID=UPI003F2131AF